MLTNILQLHYILLCDKKNKITQTPNNKIPARAMPYSGEEPYDQHISYMLYN